MSVRRILANLCRRMPLPMLNVAEQLRNTLSGSGRLHLAHAPDTRQGIITLSDEMGDSIHICRFRRRRLYGQGIMRRVHDLAEMYCLNGLNLLPSGVFIDCGANIGELGIWAQSVDLTYIPFEPEPLEAFRCDLNNFGGSPETRRRALWKETTRLPFYSKPDSADSSLIAPGEDWRRIEVEAVTLDSALDLTQLAGSLGTVTLKVEAEGAEPEVLEGAVETLALVDWVPIDCGPERGEQRAHTFVETNTFMQDHGFRLCRARFDRVTALYSNTRRLPS